MSGIFRNGRLFEIEEQCEDVITSNDEYKVIIHEHTFSVPLYIMYHANYVFIYRKDVGYYIKKNRRRCPIKATNILSKVLGVHMTYLASRGYSIPSEDEDKIVLKLKGLWR